ncbi:universal stress protein [Flagellimonas zhangzhouensis]|uniref:Nucleotide-binding universal stress protein, UspA family n=1 Tax=Flagellimonas zhangzhouensis TaxID=1073328 RepID=A0A1H2QCF1_9FLAO|nr:universal stress protein [Allomuricauda zhangzhouensis]SDQ51360.1 Nucleotide-binding universal stress protein, UspA family [Allomuricauda zhangzhouensis]SDW04802.1 Nucleotide-binding universal stress protein, UspA family [Allomuricauda zhangzhouensis]
MRTVLIPTDFSKNALHAIQYAQELFKCERACFFILNAYAEDVYGEFHNASQNDIEKYKEEKRQEVQKKLDDLLDGVVGTPPNPLHTFETIASFDNLVDSVNDFVDEMNIDLVIMGTKGETSDHKTTFGSYTIEIFKYVKCPVLAVPEDFDYRQPKSILFPTDYMLPYKRRELKLLGDMAGKFKSNIHCLYITDFEDLSLRQEDNRLFLEQTLSRPFVHFETTSVKNKAEAILEHLEDKDAGMLVMVNSRHSFFEDMLYRSTVDLLGLKVKVPFLVMQNLKR